MTVLMKFVWLIKWSGLVSSVNDIIKFCAAYQCKIYWNEAKIKSLAYNFLFRIAYLFLTNVNLLNEIVQVLKFVIHKFLSS